MWTSWWIRELWGRTNATPLSRRKRPTTPPDAPLHDFHQRAFAAAVAVHPHHPDHRPVAMHQRAHLARGEEQVGARVVGTEEPESVPMPDDAPRDEVHPVDQPEIAAAVADDLAVALHGAQPPLQRLVSGGGPERVRFGDPHERDGRAAAREELDQDVSFGEVRDTGTGAARGFATGMEGFR